MNVTNYFLALALLVSTAFQQQNEFPPNISGPEKVLSELENALSSILPNSHDAFTLYSDAAQHLARRGSYKAADSLFVKANKLAIHETDSVDIIEMRLSKANMNKEQGKYTAALQTYAEALDFYQKREDINGQLWVYGHLTEFYRATLNTELSIKFIEEGEALISSSNVDIRAKANLLFGKASYYLQFYKTEIQSNFDSIFYHLGESLNIAKESGDSYLIGLSENGLGYLLMHNASQESEKIIGYLESAKDNMLANERYRNYTVVLQNLALYHTRNGHPDRAVDLTLEAISLSKKNNWTSILSDMYRLAGEVYYELSQFKESAEYLNEALMAKIVDMAKSHSIALGELTANHEKNIAEQKLSEQEIETRIAQTQAVRNRKALITTVIISLIFLAIAVTSVMLYLRLKGANNKLLTQQEITRKTNAKLKDVVEQKNVLYKEVNHRVKNNLTVLSSLIYLQEDGEQNESQKELYQTLRHRIQSMALVHQNLYQFDEALSINFQNYLRQLIPEIAAAYSGDKNVSTNISCENLIVTIDEAVPMAMIINELITNSFKYAFIAKSEGKIELFSTVSEGKRVIHYRDNGPGIKEEPEKDQRQKLGMLLVKLMTEQLKGTLAYEGDSKGVYFRIELPDPD